MGLLVTHIALLQQAVTDTFSEKFVWLNDNTNLEDDMLPIRMVRYDLTMRHPTILLSVAMEVLVFQRSRLTCTSDVVETLSVTQGMEHEIQPIQFELRVNTLTSRHSQGYMW